MNRYLFSIRSVFLPFAAVAWVGLFAAQAMAQDQTVYKCPGNLYTDALSAKEAKDKNCRTLDGAPITIIQAVRPKPSVSSSRASSSSSSGGGSNNVASQDQKARDADARLILETELKKGREAMDALRKEYNNGQPERRGDERQAAKYAERVQDLKDAIARKAADLNSVERELSKIGVTPPPPASTNVIE